MLSVGFIGSHSLHLNDIGQNIDQLNPVEFRWRQRGAATKSVANPFYGIANGGVGTVGNKTVSPRSNCLLPFPQYTFGFALEQR